MHLHTHQDVDDEVFMKVATAIDKLWQGNHRLHLIALFQWANWIRNRGFELTPRCKEVLKALELPTSNTQPGILPIGDVVRISRASFRGYGYGDDEDETMPSLELLNPISGAVIGTFGNRLKRAA